MSESKADHRKVLDHTRATLERLEKLVQEPYPNGPRWPDLEAGLRILRREVNALIEHEKEIERGIPAI